MEASLGLGRSMRVRKRSPEFCCPSTQSPVWWCRAGGGLQRVASGVGAAKAEHGRIRHLCVEVSVTLKASHCAEYYN